VGLGEQIREHQRKKGKRRAGCVEDVQRMCKDVHACVEDVHACARMCTHVHACVEGVQRCVHVCMFLGVIDESCIS